MTLYSAYLLSVLTICDPKQVIFLDIALTILTGYPRCPIFIVILLVGWAEKEREKCWSMPYCVGKAFLCLSICMGIYYVS